MEGLKYEISLRIIKQCYSPEVKLKFGLLRISQCSNNGKYFFKKLYFNVNLIKYSVLRLKTCT